MTTSINELVTTCLGEIERKYGTGRNDGEFPHKYHNRMHTEEVIADTLAIADLAIQNGTLLPRQKELLHVAAAFHDIEQMTPEYGNELASSDIMENMVAPTHLFTLDELLEIREAILGTETSFINGVRTQIYAQSDLAKILADADLAHLGKETQTYREHSEKLFSEFFPNETVQEREDFLKESAVLLENHRYFMPEAERSFPHQEENLLFVRGELSEKNSAV